MIVLWNGVEVDEKLIRRVVDAEFRQILLMSSLTSTTWTVSYPSGDIGCGWNASTQPALQKKLERVNTFWKLANQIHDKAVLPPFLASRVPYHDSSSPEGPGTLHEEIQKTTGRMRTADKLKICFDLQGFLTAEDNNSGEPTLRGGGSKNENEAVSDLLEVKKELRDTHCLTEDRKRLLIVLQVKLSQVEQQNIELQSLLDTQKGKLMELDKIKSKQSHKDEVNCLEEPHSSRISELQFKVDSLKRDYEDKIRRITDSNLSLFKTKRGRNSGVTESVKDKTSQQSNDSSERKRLHKEESDLKQEIEVQIQTQKTDLMVKHSAAKQEELRNALNSLEGKYKKMMETLQLHALESKRHDDKLIEELKTLLEKHNISYL
ncbi:hypothetical protein MTP99_017667 [Tenebrio molitor]|nr:hypothetical protein MTP99_017667 [Tenebrio molitor]